MSHNKIADAAATGNRAPDFTNATLARAAVGATRAQARAVELDRYPASGTADCRGSVRLADYGC